MAVDIKPVTAAVSKAVDRLAQGSQGLTRQQMAEELGREAQWTAGIVEAGAVGTREQVSALGKDIFHVAQGGLKPVGKDVANLGKALLGDGWLGGMAVGELALNAAAYAGKTVGDAARSLGQAIRSKLAAL